MEGTAAAVAVLRGEAWALGARVAGGGRVGARVAGGGGAVARVAEAAEAVAMKKKGMRCCSCRCSSTARPYKCTGTEHILPRTGCGIRNPYCSRDGSMGMFDSKIQRCKALCIHLQS